MAYSEEIARRIRNKLSDFQVDFNEKKMFGGIAFMISDKMCVGVVKDRMMLRVLEDRYDELIEENHVHPMEFTGKTMRGFIFLDEKAFESEADLDRWIGYGLEFGEKGVLKSKKK